MWTKCCTRTYLKSPNVWGQIWPRMHLPHLRINLSAVQVLIVQSFSVAVLLWWSQRVRPPWFHDWSSNTSCMVSYQRQAKGWHWWRMWEMYSADINQFGCGQIGLPKPALHAFTSDPACMVIYTTFLITVHSFYTEKRHDSLFKIIFNNKVPFITFF